MKKQAFITLAMAIANTEECAECGAQIMYWALDKEGLCPKCTKEKKPGPFHMCDRCGAIKPLVNDSAVEICNRCGTEMSQIRFCRHCGRTLSRTTESICSYCLAEPIELLCSNCCRTYHIPRHMANHEHVCPWCEKRMGRVDL